MAEASQDVTVPDMDSTELFQAAMSDEQPAPEPVAATPPEQPTEERARDDQGRFVPKEATPPATPAEAAKPEGQEPTSRQTPPIPEDAAQVPSWRLREVREAREASDRRANEAEQRGYALQNEMQAMRNELQRLQKPAPEPVDFFQNPDDAFKQRTAPIEERMVALEAQVRLSTSRAVAVATHGAAKVAEMDQAIAKAMREGNPEMNTLRAQLQASEDPVGLAIQWHQRSKVVEKIGANFDLDAYVEKVIEERAKDPKHQAKVIENARVTAGGAAQNGSRPNIQLPPSLNKAGGGAGNDAQSFTDADMGDAALFRHAMDSPRR